MPNKVEKDEVEEVEAGDVEAVEDKNKDRKHDWGAADLEKVWRRASKRAAKSASDLNNLEVTRILFVFAILKLLNYVLLSIGLL